MYQKIKTGLSGTMPAQLMGRNEGNGKEGSLAFLQGEGSWTKEASWLYFAFLVSLFKGKMKEKSETWPVTQIPQAEPSTAMILTVCLYSVCVR